jgi:hypothetical protein
VKKTYHSHESFASSESFDHADFGVWRTSRNDKWEYRELVQLVVGQAVEFGGRHDHGLGHGIADLVHIRQDTNLDGDGSGSAGVISCQHVDFDPRSVASPDCVGGLLSWWIVETDETAEDKVLFDFLPGRWSSTTCSAFFLDIVRSASKGEDTKTLRSERFHVLENLLLLGVIHLDIAIVFLRPSDGGAGINYSLDGTFGVHHLFFRFEVLEYDRHFLDVRVERILTDLLVGGIRAIEKFGAVVIKSRGENLKGDFRRISSCFPGAFVILMHVG